MPRPARPGGRADGGHRVEGGGLVQRRKRELAQRLVDPGVEEHRTVKRVPPWTTRWAIASASHIPSIASRSTWGRPDPPSRRARRL